MQRMMERRWARGAAVIAMVAVSATATAQSAPPAKPGGATKAPVTAADAKAAELRQHFEAGTKAAAAQDWKKAADEFGAAVAIHPLPQIIGYLGEAELKLGRFRDAAEHLERFLREDKKATKAELDHGRELLTTAKTKVATLVISVDGVGVDPEVFINTRNMGKAPLAPEVYLEPGKYKIEARSGELNDEKTEDVQAGWTRVVKLVIRAAGPPLAPTTTATATATGEGSKSPGSSFPGRTVSLVSGGVVAGVGLAIGIVGTALWTSKTSDRDGICTIDTCLNSGMVGYDAQKERWVMADSQRASNGSMAIAGFVVAGLAAAGTGMVYFLWKPSQSGTVQAVTVIPTGTGAVLKATW